MHFTTPQAPTPGARRLPAPESKSGSFQMPCGQQGGSLTVMQEWEAVANASPPPVPLGLQAVRIADSTLARIFNDPAAAATDDRPDPAELLRKSGYRLTLRDHAADFIFAVRAQRRLALICTAAGFLAGLLGVIVPAIVIAWWMS